MYLKHVKAIGALLGFLLGTFVVTTVVLNHRFHTIKVNSYAVPYFPHTEVEDGTMTEDSIPTKAKPILSTVHFVFLSGTKVMKPSTYEEGLRLTTTGKSWGNRPFGMMDYIAIKAAWERINPAQIFFHYNTEPPSSIWWNLSKRYLTLHKVEEITSIFGRPIGHVAHKSDVIRLEQLLQTGGIYLDLDVIALRSFDRLMAVAEKGKTLMGKESPNGLGNAVIVAPPNATFLRYWLDSYKTFSEEEWNKFSVRLPYQLSLEHPDDIEVLDERTFFWPPWHGNGLQMLYEEDVTPEFSEDVTLAVHLWNSALHGGRKADASPSGLWERDTTFTTIARNALFYDPLVGHIVPRFAVYPVNYHEIVVWVQREDLLGGWVDHITEMGMELRVVDKPSNDSNNHNGDNNHELSGDSFEEFKWHILSPTRPSGGGQPAEGAATPDWNFWMRMRRIVIHKDSRQEIAMENERWLIVSSGLVRVLTESHDCGSLPNCCGAKFDILQDCVKAFSN